MAVNSRLSGHSFRAHDSAEHRCCSRFRVVGRSYSRSDSKPALRRAVCPRDRGPDFHVRLAGSPYRHVDPALPSWPRPCVGCSAACRGVRRLLGKVDEVRRRGVGWLCGAQGRQVEEVSIVAAGGGTSGFYAPRIPPAPHPPGRWRREACGASPRAGSSGFPYSSGGPAWKTGNLRACPARP